MPWTKCFLLIKYREEIKWPLIIPSQSLTISPNSSTASFIKPSPTCPLRPLFHPLTDLRRKWKSLLQYRPAWRCSDSSKRIRPPLVARTGRWMRPTTSFSWWLATASLMQWIVRTSNLPTGTTSPNWFQTGTVQHASSGTCHCVPPASPMLLGLWMSESCFFGSFKMRIRMGWTGSVSARGCMRRVRRRCFELASNVESTTLASCGQIWKSTLFFIQRRMDWWGRLRVDGPLSKAGQKMVKNDEVY